MAHFGLRLGCWQRDCSATNGGPPELDHSNKGTGSSIRVDAHWSEAAAANVRVMPEPAGTQVCRWLAALRLISVAPSTRIETFGWTEYKRKNTIRSTSLKPPYHICRGWRLSIDYTSHDHCDIFVKERIVQKTYRFYRQRKKKYCGTQWKTLYPKLNLT